MKARALLEQCKVYWDILITLVTSYTAFYLPYNLSFYHTLDENHFVQLNWLSALFILDILVNLGYQRYVRKTIVQGENNVKAYLKGYFIFDLLAVLPWGGMLGAPVWNLFRLVKLVKVWRYFNEYRQRSISYSNHLLLLVSIFWFFHIAHWLSCGWINMVGVKPGVGPMETYVDALYWCITTLTTVGYGDITPIGVDQKIYTIFVQILGVGVYGLLIGNLATILAQTDPARARYRENMEKLASLLHFQNLPRDLQQRIREYFTYLYKRRLGYDEQDLLESLPPGLRAEVSVYLKHELIEKIPLFSDAPEAFIRQISNVLEPQVATPGTILFEAGEEPLAMYFVVQGELQALSPDLERAYATMTDGDYFGEIALYSHKTRTATVRANSYCDLYRLNRKDFDDIVRAFPTVSKEIEEQVKLREERQSGFKDD